MSLVYLGGPIDLVSEEGRHNWRESMKEVLSAYGHSSLDPASEFKVNLADHSSTKKLVDINHYAMMACDVVFLVMSPNLPSIGTPIELYMLTQSKQDYVVIWNPTDVPKIRQHGKFALYNRTHVPEELPAYISGLTDKVVSSFADAIAYVEYREKALDGSFFGLPSNPPPRIPVEVEAPKKA